MLKQRTTQEKVKLKGIKQNLVNFNLIRNLFYTATNLNKIQCANKLHTFMSTNSLAEQCMADGRCFFTPRLGGVGRKNGSSLKVARVFPSANNYG